MSALVGFTAGLVGLGVLAMVLGALFPQWPRALPWSGATLALLLTGCATAARMPPDLSSAEQAAFQRAQGMAQQVSSGKVAIVVTLHPRTSYVAGSFGRGAIYLSRGALPSPHVLVMVAHELGHWQRRHGPADSSREAERQEREAHAAGVKILGRYLGDERAALVAFRDALLRLHRDREAIVPAHKPPCVALQDLLADFPQYPDVAGCDAG